MGGIFCLHNAFPSAPPTKFFQLLVTASVPGKVLLTGSYLITERPYSGIVLTVDSLFTSSVQVKTRTPIPSFLPREEIPLLVHLVSPQFSYDQTFLLNRSLSLVPLARIPPHVEHLMTTFHSAVSLIIRAVCDLQQWSLDEFYRQSLALLNLDKASRAYAHHLAVEITITTLADNAFYSQHELLQSRNLPRTPSVLASLPSFSSVNPRHLAKTGIGSSAALVSSLCAALLRIFVPSSTIEIMYRLAQAVHSVAQGRVGSGFDISAAFRGSQIYTRFSPSLLQPLFPPSTSTSNPIPPPPPPPPPSAAFPPDPLGVPQAVLCEPHELPVSGILDVIGADLVQCCCGPDGNTASCPWDDVSVPFVLPGA
ncbi:putative phosphomevalonate kinase [Paratrimastix pyriformis]|uniref:phosphomevalonate kinase n=1 Tax=Paratrimastix pyriformis TaxID=342808 RepID=A0ABQ8UDJ2_9EUKA|nr:putative phosphomevalonate kinase [Paratrimastix pyriformis]